MLETIVGIMATTFIGTIGWVFQKAFVLGTRVTVLEVQQEGFEELIKSEFAAVNGRLDRIERGMNGWLTGQHRDK